MKTHKENILEHLQKFLDDNVSDYTNFNSDYWFKKYKKHYYRKMNFEEIETLLETLTFIKETIKEWKKLGDKNE